MDLDQWGLQALLEGRIASGDKSVALFAIGPEDAARRFRELSTDTYRRLWNMQPGTTLSAVRASRAANATLAPAIDYRFLLSSLAAKRGPLLVKARTDGVRLGRAEHQLLVLDERLLCFAGPRTADGLITVWYSVASDLIEMASAVFLECWDNAVPMPPSRLSPRMADIVLDMLDGYTDVQIARAEGISERTVQREISEAMRRLDVKSRVQLVGLLAD